MINPILFMGFPHLHDFPWQRTPRRNLCSLLWRGNQRRLHIFWPQGELLWLSSSIVDTLSNTGWWFFATPLKNDGVKVSWDDDIPFPTEWTVIKSMVPNHQPENNMVFHGYLIDISIGFPIMGKYPTSSPTFSNPTWWSRSVETSKQQKLYGQLSHHGS